MEELGRLVHEVKSRRKEKAPKDLKGVGGRSKVQRSKFIDQKPRFSTDVWTERKFATCPPNQKKMPT